MKDGPRARLFLEQIIIEPPSQYCILVARGKAGIGSFAGYHVEVGTTVLCL